MLTQVERSGEWESAVTLRHELHAHPELSNCESWTKTHLMAYLRAHTDLEIVDRGLWFYARYRSGQPGPGIAFRADMDAIAFDENDALPYHSLCPGAAHKCGHEGHCASLAAFATAIAREGAPRDVYFLFQHAEETGDGAKECCDLLREQDIAAIYGYHNLPAAPLGQVFVREGTIMCASKGMAIRFHGAPTHASIPENGKNPALAIAESIAALPAIFAPETRRGLVLCTVVHIWMGEKAFGVSPGEAELCLTCRAQYEDELEELCAAIEATVAQRCDAHDLRYDIAIHDAFPETFNHTENVEAIRRVCAANGRPCVDLVDPIRSSEDFGHYTKLVPGAFFFLGAGDVSGWHTHDFDFSDALIGVAVEVFRGLVHDASSTNV